MKKKLHEWVNVALPLMINGTFKRMEAEVLEGKAIACFNEWEIRIELTPNKEIAKRIEDNF